MSFYNGTPNAGGLGQVRNAVGSFFQNLFKPNTDNQPATADVVQPAVSRYEPSTYQIGPDDISLDQVATNLNVPLQQLVDNNDGARTLPPIGSFMAVQPQNTNQAGKPIEAFNVPSYAQSISQMQGSQMRSETMRYAPIVQTRMEVSSVEFMFRNGQLPPQISGAAAAQMINPQTGQPFTPADFEADGYKWDGQRYVQGAIAPTAPATGSTPVVTGIGTGSAEFMGTGFMQKNAANQTEFSRQLRWDPERKRYVQLGTLIREGRLNVRDPRARLKASKKGKQKASVAAPVAVASNAPDTPTQQLALVLGSG
jgi:hypothetical protein